MQPRVGLGHDLVLGLLDPIYQTPRNAFARPVERRYAIAPHFHDQGLYVAFLFDMIDSEATYIQILSQFGLLVDDTSEVTVHIWSPRMAPTLYNGIAFLPEAGADWKWENFFARGVELYVCDLQTFS